MHIMGKVGVWLVVVASIAATVLTSKLIQVRNSWTKKSVAAQTQYQALLPKIAEAQEQLAKYEAERFRAIELWGTSSPPVQTVVQAQGVLVANIGTDSPLIADKKIVYAFEVQPDNSVIYRGDFTVTGAQNAQCQLTPNWRVRVEDGQTWKSGNWRFRNQIPSAFQPNFDKQLIVIGQTEETLAARREAVAQEVAELAKAQEQMKLREAELIGGEQLSKEADAPVEYREGLVAAVEQVEEARNKILTKVDELRRKIRSAKASVDQLEQANRELAAKLPQPQASQVTSKP